MAHHPMLIEHGHEPALLHALSVFLGVAQPPEQAALALCTSVVPLCEVGCGEQVAGASRPAGSVTLLSPPGCSLQLLEQQVVGGEQAKNKDLKEKHKRRKRYADERKKQLVAALQNSDEDSGDWVLLNVYDSIQEEVRAKSKLLEKMQKKVRPCLAQVPSFMAQLATLCSSHKHLLSACCVSLLLLQEKCLTRA